MDVKVLITGNNLKDKTFSLLSISCQSKIIFRSNDRNREINNGQNVTLKVENGAFYINNELFSAREKIDFTSADFILLKNITRLYQGQSINPQYRGRFEAWQDSDNRFKLIQVVNLEDYVLGSIASEMPLNFNLEALKAQSVACRTYALNPRVSHAIDRANVCDSYFCCLYYCGNKKEAEKFKTSVDGTSDKVIVYQGKPILALFSSCAGGQTNNYSDCFYDPVTGSFPSLPVPYLTSTLETDSKNTYLKLSNLDKTYKSNHSELSQHHKAIEYLYNNNVKTYDSDTSQFKWSLEVSSDELENHLHFNIFELLKDPVHSNLIKPSQSNIFGHINNMYISSYAASNVAKELTIETSHGNWQIRSEILIRKLFKNVKANLKLLHSAKFFIKTELGKLNLLKNTTFIGLGLGHGVGMQQIGANGMANRGKNYQEILNHYYLNAKIINSKDLS